MASIKEFYGDNTQLYDSIIKKVNFNLRCCMPGIIQSYDKGTNTAEIQPAIREEIVNEDNSISYLNLPLLINVPVVFLTSTEGGLTLELKRGDECLVFFSDLSIDNFWLNGNVQNPIEVRRHDLSDGIAIPCRLSLSVAKGPDQKLNIEMGDVSIKFNVDDMTFRGGFGSFTGKQVYQLIHGQIASGVTSFNGRSGEVLPSYNDYTYEMVGADKSGAASAVQDSLDDHVDDKSNPHDVTADQVGTYTKQEIDSAVGGIDAVKYTAQELANEQQDQARVNISACEKIHAAQHATDGEDPIYLGMIGAASQSDVDNINQKVSFKQSLSRSVTVNAAMLVSYINGLDRFVTDLLTIKVNSGTVTDAVDLSGFFGDGRIVIQSASGSNDVTLAGGVVAYRCQLEINLLNLNISGMDDSQKAAVATLSGGYMQISNCVISQSGSATRGISVGTGSKLYMYGGSISGFSTAVLCQHTGTLSLNDVSASGNTTGGFVWAGGIILLGGSTPDTIGGSSNGKAGGIIVKANGTLL